VSILAVNGYSTQVMSRQHVFAMSWTIDPASDCTLHRICLPIVICYIFCKTSFEERHLLTALIKVSMTNWHNTICHRYAMLHRDIVQSLIPS